jgi:hypothetical protein
VPQEANDHLLGMSQTTLSRAPERLNRRTGCKVDEPQVPGLSRQLFAQWWAEFQSTLEQHELDGKIFRETAATMERFQKMVELFLNVICEKGQEHFKEFLWAKRNFDDCVSQIGGVLEASGLKEDCFNALRQFLAAEDIQERPEASASSEACNQAFQTMGKSQMVQAEAFRRECLAARWFAEQFDRYTEMLKAHSRPSRRSNWLEQYSEARGRYFRQGRGWQSLWTEYLVDQSDPQSASFAPETREKRKRKIRNAYSDGRWFSKMNRQFGPGIFCYARIQTKTA